MFIYVVPAVGLNVGPVRPTIVAIDAGADYYLFC